MVQPLHLNKLQLWIDTGVECESYSETFYIYFTLAIRGSVKKIGGSQVTPPHLKLKMLTCTHAATKK